MRSGKREQRDNTKQQAKNKQRTARDHSACKGMRVRVGDPWELDVKESSAPAMTVTKAKAILFVLAIAGFVFMIFTAYAMWAGDKTMITQSWSTAQSVLTGVLVWALGQRRA